MDTLICAELYRTYSQLITLIDQLIVFPSAALAVLRNAIKQIETVIYKNIMASYDDLVGAVEKLLEMPDSLDDLTDDLCELLLKCDIMVRSTVPANTGSYDSYEWFKTFVCANGFQTYLDKLRQNVKGFVLDMIDSLMGMTGLEYVRTKIEEIIRQYNDFIKQPIKDYFPPFPASFKLIFPWVINDNVFDPDKGNIFDLMEFLKNYAECIFEACDFSVCVYNKIADVEDKLKYDTTTGEYIPNDTEIDMIAADVRVRSQIDAWLTMPELQ